MKVTIYNQNKEKTEEIELPKEIFDVQMNADLVHQVVVSQMANRRKVIAHTKDRGDVRGGGKKPWRQKGTGRARHGSRRSPIWKGGGVTFGPTNERVYKKEIPKKMQRKALMMVLSAKIKSNSFLILDKINLKESKTKLMAEVMKNLSIVNETCLIALPKKEDKIIRVVNNISKVKTIEARNLNCLDLLNSKHLVILKESIKTIEETFIKRKVQSEKCKITTQNLK